MLQNVELDTFEGDRFPVILGSNVPVHEPRMDNQTMDGCGFLQLPLACHVLAIMLDAVLCNRQAPHTSDIAVSNGYQKAEEFTVKLIWDICNLSEQMLLQSSDHRSSAICYLLPVIFEALLSHHSLEISIQGHACNLSRLGLQVLSTLCFKHVACPRFKNSVSPHYSLNAHDCLTGTNSS